ncbi:Smr/MutS family protein [Roseospirillum parvum]|uniref:DNA-nicking endonuclease, Smr domain n=1 Tax=Roseospirillum parvum TaxID=83401 RepID=A0A1G8DPK0_9PROT|nr:Smr/MutS family protein [Roseospirillum parvum]SDH59578.1 DNA-nicking endonuclease, Smr domain [Roseospirillum parvum]
MSRRRRPEPDPEDLELWQRVTAEVIPLGQPHRRRHATPDHPTLGRPRSLDPSTAPRGRGAVPLAAGHTAGIDKRTAERFTKGRMEIDSRLDLHGMTRERAHRALVRHLHTAHAAGQRCVLVITGRGSRDPEVRHQPWSNHAPGVLRGELPRWLNQPGLRGLVLSFSQAKPQDGGSGAFYVLLKRQRI